MQDIFYTPKQRKGWLSLYVQLVETQSCSIEKP